MHCYDDDGHLQFDHNRKLLVKLAEASDWKFDTQQDRINYRSNIVELAYDLVGDYQIQLGFDGIGGASPNEWKASVDADNVRQALKEMMVDFIDRGFVYKEFPLAAWSACCDIQLTYILS